MKCRAADEFDPCFAIQEGDMSQQRSPLLEREVYPQAEQLASHPYQVVLVPPSQILLLSYGACLLLIRGTSISAGQSDDLLIQLSVFRRTSDFLAWRSALI